MDVYGENLYHCELNLALFTRQGVQKVGNLYFYDEEISNSEIVTPLTRKGAVLAARNEETNIIIVATSSTRERPVPAGAVRLTVNNEETAKKVATPSIREGTVLAVTVRETVDNEETAKKVATSSIRKRAVLAAVAQRVAINEETTSEVEQFKYYKTSEILQNTTKQTGYNSIVLLFIVDQYHAISFSAILHNMMSIYQINTYFIMLFSVFNMCEKYCASMRQLMLSGDIELNPGPVNQRAIRTLPNSITILQSRLAERGLQFLDVGGAGDCFFRAVSHQLYGDSSHHLSVRSVGVQYLRNNPERFIESNTENSWVRYLTNMSFQGMWADALVIQAVADALNVTINIVESHAQFAPLTIISPINVVNVNPIEINIGHLEESHYVSTQRSLLQPSVLQEFDNDSRIPMNKPCAMSVYSICLSTIKSCSYWNSTTALDAINEHANLFYDSLLLNEAYSIPNVIKIYDADINMQCDQIHRGLSSQSFCHTIKNTIFENTHENNTGFLICFSDTFISCIIQHNAKKQSFKYFALVSSNDQFEFLQPSWIDLDTFIVNVYSFIEQTGCHGNYDIYFLSCSTPATNNNNLRQRVLRKFKSNEQKTT